MTSASQSRPAPQVSVLTAVRDGEPYLEATIESLRAQSLDDWEWILVDDGSSDGTVARLEAEAGRDSRLRVLPRPASGLVAALNHGLEHCRAPLVARIDADDIAPRGRLALQVAAFADDPTDTVIDGRVELFGGERNQGMIDYVDWLNDHSDHRSIVDDIFVESPIVHPAVCFRRQAVSEIGGYRAGDFPEDYDLWLRLHARGARFRKLPETLLRWRDHPDRLTRTDRRYRSAAFTALKQTWLWELEGSDLAAPGMVLWGAGRSTRSWRQWLRRHGVRPSFVVDANPRRLGQTILDAPVVPATELERRPWNYLLVTVSSPTSRAEIRRQLRERGLDTAAGRHIRFV